MNQNIETRFFIGANNQTGEVDYPLIKKILRSSFLGWTLTPTTGAYVDDDDVVHEEPSCTVTVFTILTYEECVQVAAELATLLEQYSVGLSYNHGPLLFITPSHTIAAQTA